MDAPATVPTLVPRLEGVPDGPTVFFVQGWPDDCTLWDGLVASLRDRYRCVRINLPNYPGAESRRWGYGHDAIVDSLAQCIGRVSPGRPVTIVAHDWGAFWGYLLHSRHPELVERFVALDVGPTVKPTPREAAIVAAYQGWLAAAFVVGGPVGDAMTRLFARLTGSPKQGKAVSSRMNYPYFYTWKAILAGRRPGPSRYAPEVPFLVIYGAKKLVRFHTERWLEYVRSRPGNQVVELPETGHWVMRDPALNRLVREFLDRTNAPTQREASP